MSQEQIEQTINSIQAQIEILQDVKGKYETLVSGIYKDITDVNTLKSQLNNTLTNDKGEWSDGFAKALGELDDVKDFSTTLRSATFEDLYSILNDNINGVSIS